MRNLLLLFLIISSLKASTQENDQRLYLGVLAGKTNYQGDLQPNSFSFKNAHSIYQLWIRKAFSNRISLRTGISIGKISADDKNNRDYLQARNLNFTSTLKEGYLNLDLSFFNIHQTGWTPYVYGGLIVFHFNPYTKDTSGQKYYLKPLSTEGQGLSDYPDRKPYRLTQFALGFGGGLRIKANENFTIGIDLSQRKTFTDYLDDVSNSYVDRDKLLAAKGAKAVELAFRSNEINSTVSYPSHGEQRGTPKEMDWYYYAGLSIEVNLSTAGNLFSSLFQKNKDAYSRRCPRVF